jgi:hypothetical protein
MLFCFEIKTLGSLTLPHSVFKLTKNIPIAGVITLLSSLGFVFGVYAGVRSGIINE